MLYHLFDYLEQTTQPIGAGIWRFITFRAGVAIVISLIISMLFGGKIIRYIQQKQVGETIRDLGLEGQMEKAGTPTMGGIIILLAILVPCLLVADLTNIYILLMLCATIFMGIIGFTDDYIKVFKKDKKGLPGKFKVAGQVGLGLIVALTMLLSDDVVVRTTPEVAAAEGYEVIKEVYGDDGTISGVNVKAPLTNVPFLKDHRLNYNYFVQFIGDNPDKWTWLLFVPLVIFIVTAISNGANLTDGLDGLSIGVSGIVAFTLLILAYAGGNAIAADYLNIMFLPGTSELVIFCACLVGACLGFLWYNGHPAQIFMGDTGSLTLGGIIAALAILIRTELLLPLLCGIFLVENLSVVLQVGYFKYTKRKYGEGRRIFKMSPLHHHYQKLGMPETKIVLRFWIVTILLAVVTLLTLKFR